MLFLIYFFTDLIVGVGVCWFTSIPPSMWKFWRRKVRFSSQDH